MAWGAALLVDAVQIGLLPLTGTLSTWVNAPLDLAAMGLLWALTGWHWAYLPSLLVELIPFVEVVPSWTVAVWLGTRSTPDGRPR